MPLHLVVTQPFADHAVGDRITNDVQAVMEAHRDKVVPIDVSAPPSKKDD